MLKLEAKSPFFSGRIDGCQEARPWEVAVEAGGRQGETKHAGASTGARGGRGWAARAGVQEEITTELENVQVG